ncbi:MAG: hypothetical protein ACI9DF_002545 [Verrucomicrobiales bacterium]|jgi:hypothetical protein
MVKRFSFLAMTASLVACMLGLTQDEAVVEKPSLSRHPYVQLTTTSSAMVVWRTLGVSEPVLRYGTSPEALTEEVREGLIKHPPVSAFDPIGGMEGEPEGLQLPRLWSAPPDTYQYEWTLNGLAAGTVYYYAVYHGDELLAGGDSEHFVRTIPPPESEQSLRFWVVGDSGNGGLLQRESFKAIQAQVAATRVPIDAYIHLGDMAYVSGTDDEFEMNFFQIYSPLLRNTVTWPTMGNHEAASASGVTGIGVYYDAYVTPTQGEAGGVPSGSESYYAFDYGPVHFVCLNSHDLNRAPDGEMAQWLREDLSRVEAKWLVAFFHHPPYSKGTHDSDTETQLVEMREHIMPILESHGIDLVLSGHSHTYERSMLIDGAYATPTVAEGVIYDDGDGDPLNDGAYRKSADLNPNGGTLAVVAGNGRGGVQALGLSPIMRRVVPEAGSLLLDLQGERLTGYMINDLNQLRDRFQIIKSGQVPVPDRLDHPWQPNGPTVTTASLGSGQMKIVITPVPKAPDAVVHYTLDGSAVTEESPVYENPLIVSQDVFLQAWSTWRGGARKSPTTQAGWLRVGNRMAVNLPILNAEDDMVLQKGVVISNEDVLPLDGTQVALHFRDVQLPPHVTIGRAYLQLAAGTADSNTGTVTIRVDRRADSPPLVDADDPLDERPWLERSILWELAPWVFPGSRLTSERSPDLSSLLQALVDQENWQTGGALTFLLEGSADRAMAAFERNPQLAARLVIRYEPLPPLQAVVSQPPLLQRSKESGIPVSRLTFRRLTSDLGSPLTYTLEQSTTLAPDSWVPAQGWEPIESHQFEGPWQFANYRFNGVLEGPYYLRFRISSE